MIIDFAEVNLTSQQVLERITEQSIYEYYINDTIKESKLVKCCFHKDSNPSMGFYKTSANSLNFKCFGCGAQGNVFNFVSRLYNCNFGNALRIIDNTFKLSKNYGSSQNNQIHQERSVQTGSFLEEKSRTEILPTFRNFNKVDYDYWNQYYIPLELLVKYNIKACSRVYIIKKSGEYKLYAEHTNSNPIYSYQIDNSYKIYRPYSDKKGKWISNTDNFNIQGLLQLPNKGELLIITSSMKDVLVLNIMGYNAIALGGEGNNIPDKILDYLWACFDNIVVFYDNDQPGLKYGKKFSEQIGGGYIYIPVEYEDTKDISDFVKKYSLESGIQLMKKLL